MTSYFLGLILALALVGLVMNGPVWYRMYRFGLPIGRSIAWWFFGSIVASVLLQVIITAFDYVLMGSDPDEVVQMDQPERNGIIEVSISATLDGRPFHGAIVEIDGEDVGFTPYKGTLTRDEEHYLMVIPPDDQEFAESYCESEIPENFLGYIQPCSFNSLPARPR